MRNGTVKQFLDALDEMRTLYAFDDEKTEICTFDYMTNNHCGLSIATTDEKTGIDIHMGKRFEIGR